MCEISPRRGSSLLYGEMLPDGVSKARDDAATLSETKLLLKARGPVSRIV